jgi:hypothetical protein
LIAPVLGYVDTRTRMIERVFGGMPINDLERRLAAAGRA